MLYSHMTKQELLNEAEDSSSLLVQALARMLRDSVSEDEFDKALEEAENAAHDAAYDKGYEEGYEEGYDEGYNEGCANAEEGNT